MPLIDHIALKPEGEIGIWHITEDKSELETFMSMEEVELENMQRMSERRQKEWMAARWLIHQLSGRTKRAKCLKDEFGKPYLEDSKFNISISHSLDMTACVASPYNVGIDIQEIVGKMQRIAKKFVSDEEWSHIPDEDSLEYLHVIWGAKEAMYKAWGRKRIDFRKEMRTEEFRWLNNVAQFKGVLRKGNIEMVFDVIARKLDNFILVYAKERLRNVYP